MKSKVKCPVTKAFLQSCDIDKALLMGFMRSPRPYPGEIARLLFVTTAMTLRRGWKEVKLQSCAPPVLTQVMQFPWSKGPSDCFRPVTNSESSE